MNVYHTETHPDKACSLILAIFQSVKKNYQTYLCSSLCGRAGNYQTWTGPRKPEINSELAKYCMSSDMRLYDFITLLIAYSFWVDFSAKRMYAGEFSTT